MKSQAKIKSEYCIAYTFVFKNKGGAYNMAPPWWEI